MLISIYSLVARRCCVSVSPAFLSPVRRKWQNCNRLASRLPGRSNYGPALPRNSCWVRSLATSSSSSSSSRDDSSRDNDKKVTPKSSLSKKTKKKFKVVDKIQQSHIDKLAQEFDNLARREGFDKSDAFFAKDATFEDADDFADYIMGEDDDDDDDDYIMGDDDDDDEWVDPEQKQMKFNKKRPGEKITHNSLSNNDTDDWNALDDDSVDTNKNDDNDDDMDARLAAAQRDQTRGSVTVPTDLTFADLQRLGFRREDRPYGDDETPRKEPPLQVLTEATVCPACGADFQCQHESRPGYLPPEKFEIQVKLKKLAEMKQLQEKAKRSEWTPEDEVEWLIQTSGSEQSPPGAGHAFVDTETMAQQMGLDLAELAKKKIICKRCHGLQNFGQVDASLRPGWTDEPLLSQQKFRDLLRPIRNHPAVIIALVDLFDFSGSVLPELDNIAGDNPVLLAANKADLLSLNKGLLRIENWVRRELEYLGVRSLANIGGSVRLISCKTGVGVAALMTKARSLAEEMDCPIYVVGAANAGKSTLLNRIISSYGKKKTNDDDDEYRTKRRAGNQNQLKGAVTTSTLPGTTLKFIKVDLGGGRLLYDTPGLLVPGTLTQLLTPQELKIVVPTKQVEPITFRLAAGKCVLLGGLARVELTADCQPFFFTFFVANGVKLHPTSAEHATAFVRKHAGTLLTPPLPPGPERLDQLGEFAEHVVDIHGTGWKTAAADIVLTGLGWIAVTGAGLAKVKISVPKDVTVHVRPPLMPFDIWETTAKHTGGRAVRKVSKTTKGKRQKGIGRS